MRKDYIKRDEVVFCDECGMLIKKGYSFDVIEKRFTSFLEAPAEKQLNYCQVHKKPYKLIKNFFGFNIPS